MEFRNETYTSCSLLYTCFWGRLVEHLLQWGFLSCFNCRFPSVSWRDWQHVVPWSWFHHWAVVEDGASPTQKTAQSSDQLFNRFSIWWRKLTYKNERFILTPETCHFEWTLLKGEQYAHVIVDLMLATWLCLNVLVSIQDYFPLLPSHPHPARPGCTPPSPAFFCICSRSLALLAFLTSISPIFSSKSLTLALIIQSIKWYIFLVHLNCYNKMLPIVWLINYGSYISLFWMMTLFEIRVLPAWLSSYRALYWGVDSHLPPSHLMVERMREHSGPSFIRVWSQEWDLSPRGASLVAQW